MNKFYFIFTFILLSLSFLTLKAENDEPIIIIETALTEGARIGFGLTYAEESTDSIGTNILIDFGNGAEEYPINNTQIWFHYGEIGEEGIVRIYGKPTDISVLHFPVPYRVTALNVSRSERMKVITCRGNEITQLDITNNPELEYLDISQNRLQQMIDISNNKKLQQLYIYENSAIPAADLDMTGYDDLTHLDIRYCNVTSVNVKNNPKLVELSIRGNPSIQMPDLTQNGELIYFGAGSESVDMIDVTGNPKLVYLEIYEGNLTEVDLSNNSELWRLVLHGHQITSLDLSNNINLAVVDCNNNNLSEIIGLPESVVYLAIDQNCFNFATLPYIDGDFTFSNQKCTVPISNAMRIEGHSIDLSAQTRGGYETLFTWKTINNKTLEQGVDYTVKDGISSFHILPGTEVYCEIMHELFEYLILKTDPIEITGVTETTGIEGIESDLLVIKGIKQNILVISEISAEINIYNLSGKIIYNGNIAQGENQISIPDSGMYLAKITANNKSSIAKVAVQ